MGCSLDGNWNSRSKPRLPPARKFTVRPEGQLVNLEARLNHIDLEVANNNFLPNLTAEAHRVGSGVSIRRADEHAAFSARCPG